MSHHPRKDIWLMFCRSPSRTNALWVCRRTVLNWHKLSPRNFFCLSFYLTAARRSLKCKKVPDKIGIKLTQSLLCHVHDDANVGFQLKLDQALVQGSDKYV